MSVKKITIEGISMFEINRYTKQFTDMMSEGFIFIDNKGIIQLYNDKAKEIFGIKDKNTFSHGVGKIENGDIIIIGDNCLGRDDGGLTTDSLKCIGIDDRNIEIGDAILAIGVFNEKRIVQSYKYVKPNECNDKLTLNSYYDNVSISSEIDFNHKKITIYINKDIFTLNYFNSIGHMVVLDSKTKNVKFYQSPGFTARTEAINDLFKGKSFRAKGLNSEFFEVIGRSIFEIHNGNQTAKECYNVAIGKNISYESQFKEINGKSTICSLYPVDQNDTRVGAVLKIEDISEIKKIIKERDEALEKLIFTERKLFEEEQIKGLFTEFIGDSKEIASVKKLAIKASKTNSTVLILGESGTGKSLLAKAIHDNSKNRNKPFINVNCGSITESLLESELFGYEGGAFTGAKGEGKTGIFELAREGTIFLDEIGEISPYLQVKLLQVLQDRTFFKVGGNKIIKVDMRIIVATNKNLEEEMLNGKFREDLYYRINVFPIWLPPLRERKQDIYLLIKNILPTLCKRMGCKEKTISSEAVEFLLTYSWPGNVRELENVIERAINLSDGYVILSKHIPIKKFSENEYEGTQLKTLKEIIDDSEKRAITKAIMHYKGDKKAAMNSLNVAKSSFYDKLKKYHLENLNSET